MYVETEQHILYFIESINRSVPKFNLFIDETFRFTFWQEAVPEPNECGIILWIRDFEN